MERKIYKLLSSAKQIVFAYALVLFSGAAYSQTTYTFNYTGSTQTISLPAGNYSIECWGGDGGNASNGTTTLSGGKGGYSTGIYTNTTTATFNVYVGGRGGNASGASQVGSGGGGMSDIAPASNSTLIIIAAGGGGGSTSGGTTNENSTGGDGGGLTGGTAIDGTGVTGGSAATGGSQTTGGSATAGTYGVGTPGGYGYGGGAANTGTAGVMHGAGGAGGNGGSGGWNGGGGGCTLTGINDHAGGGGAGYFGGGGGRGDGGAGGGGSSYIGGVTSGTTIMFGQSGFVSNPDVTGNGRVLIKELCGITLTATGANTNNAICAGNSVTLTTNAISNYSWSNGSTNSSIIVSPNSTTLYSLTAMSPSNCMTSAYITINVNSAVPSLSVLSTANSGTICLGKSIALTASGATSYSWTGGSTTFTNGQSFAPTTTNTYVVTGYNACGTSSVAVAVTVAPLSVAAVTSTSLVCSGGIATLTAFSSVGGYTWQPGNGIGGTNIVSILANTIYTVTASDGTCVGTSTVAVNANPNPSITIVATSSAVCAGESVTLTAYGANNYTWVSTSTGTTAGQATITNAPTAPTMFYVTGDNNFNCFATTGQIVLVKASPSATASISKTLSCAGNAVIVNATADGPSTYQWDANANSASTASTSVNPNMSTVYTVTATLNSTGCTDTKTVQANIYSPTISITQPTNACSGGQITLTASINNPSSNSALNYTWTIPGNPNSNGQSVIVSPTALTVYSVTANSTSNTVLCPATKATTVGIFYNPTITATPQKTFVCKGEKAKLIGGGGISYNWNNNQYVGDTLTLNFTSQGTFTYIVLGTDANGCSSTGTTSLKVQSCAGIEDLSDAVKSMITVYPNPNNGEFNLVAEKNMDVKIINDLGQLVRSYKLSALNNYQIQVTDLAKGIYFIVGENNSSLSKQKIIVK